MFKFRSRNQFPDSALLRPLTIHSATIIVDELKTVSDQEVIVQKADTVGASIGQGVASRALWAVVLAALAVIVYITFAFRGIQHAFRYGFAQSSPWLMTC